MTIAPADDPDPWHELRARADHPPARPRMPLSIEAGGALIGSIEESLGARLQADGLPIAPRGSGWCVVGATPDAALARIADGMRAAGVVSAWRDELLGVDAADGRRVALIERAAVRPLGITTRAVHLIGWAERGDVWVQQRALDKATDPGLWDTLMGGLVSGDESLADTLARETWEEAGLRIAELRDVAATHTLTVRRPVPDGYMIEHIHVHEAMVPAALVPRNQDGEVAAFACLDRAELRERLRAGAFTLEAALILVDALTLSKRG